MRPVIFVHGVWGAPGNFAPIIRRVRAQGNRTVYAPGYGVRGTGRLEDSQRELLALFAHAAELSPTGDVDVVAHSLGGFHSWVLSRDVPVATLIGLGACFQNVSRDHVPRAYRPFLPLLPQVVGPALGEVLQDGGAGDTDGAADGHAHRVVSVVSSADWVVPRVASDLRPYIGQRCRMIQIHRVRHEQLTFQTDLIWRLLTEAQS